jgi:hypothetical protein
MDKLLETDLKVACFGPKMARSRSNWTERRPDTPHSNWTLEKAPVRFRGPDCATRVYAFNLSLAA